jgi:hypothetical protein
MIDEFSEKPGRLFCNELPEKVNILVHARSYYITRQKFRSHDKV